MTDKVALANIYSIRKVSSPVVMKNLVIELEISLAKRTDQSHHSLARSLCTDLSMTGLSSLRVRAKTSLWYIN
jgi:hypothetical protein